MFYGVDDVLLHSSRQHILQSGASHSGLLGEQSLSESINQDLRIIIKTCVASSSQPLQSYSLTVPHHCAPQPY